MEEDEREQMRLAMEEVFEELHNKKRIKKVEYGRVTQKLLSEAPALELTVAVVGSHSRFVETQTLECLFEKAGQLPHQRIALRLNSVAFDYWKEYFDERFFEQIPGYERPEDRRKYEPLAIITFKVNCVQVAFSSIPDDLVVDIEYPSNIQITPQILPLDKLKGQVDLKTQSKESYFLLGAVKNNPNEDRFKNQLVLKSSYKTSEETHSETIMCSFDSGSLQDGLLLRVRQKASKDRPDRWPLEADEYWLISQHPMVRDNRFYKENRLHGPVLRSIKEVQELTRDILSKTSTLFYDEYHLNSHHFLGDQKGFYFQSYIYCMIFSSASTKEIEVHDHTGVLTVINSQHKVDELIQTAIEDEDDPIVTIKTTIDGLNGSVSHEIVGLRRDVNSCLTIFQAA